MTLQEAMKIAGDSYDITKTWNIKSDILGKVEIVSEIELDDDVTEKSIKDGDWYAVQTVTIKYGEVEIGFAHAVGTSNGCELEMPDNTIETVWVDDIFSVRNIGTVIGIIEEYVKKESAIETKLSLGLRKLEILDIKKSIAGILHGLTDEYKPTHIHAVWELGELLSSLTTEEERVGDYNAILSRVSNFIDNKGTYSIFYSIIEADGDLEEYNFSEIYYNYIDNKDEGPKKYLDILGVDYEERDYKFYITRKVLEDIFII